MSAYIFNMASSRAFNSRRDTTDSTWLLIRNKTTGGQAKGFRAIDTYIHVYLHGCKYTI